MVWGAIRADGRRVIKLYERSVNQYYYQEILNEALLEIYTTRFKFQQDGATCHTAHSTKDFLIRKNIRLLENWPAQSADLSIIENLWDKLKVEVKNRNPRSIDELWNVTREEFYKIPNDYIKKLYGSLPDRVMKVIHSKGGNTKY